MGPHTLEGEGIGKGEGGVQDRKELSQASGSSCFGDCWFGYI